MEPLPKYQNWMVPVPKVVLHGDGFNRIFHHHRHCGLANLGNTCYVNSSLQALLHLPVFCNWMLADEFHFKKCKSSFCVTCALSSTLKQMLEGGKVVWPTELCGFLQALGFHFGKQEDVNDFLVSLLGIMAEEYVKRYPEFEGVLDYCSERTTATDILFGFWVQTQVTCGACKFESVTYSFMQEVHVPLAGSVQQGLVDYFANEELELKCSEISCKQTTLCSRVESPHNTPEVLFIQLRRFNNDMEKDSARVVLNKTVKLGGSTFQLRSIIVHTGTSRDEGHYVAYARCPDNTWSYFSDTEVIPKKDKDLEGGDVQSNVYILLYQKSKSNSNKIFPKELTKISSPIGQQPFLISPMKSKVPCEKLHAVEEASEMEDMAERLMWSSDSDDTEATVTVNSRREKRKLSSQSPQQTVPMKFRIKRTLRTSPKAFSSQSSHDYEIIQKDIKTASTEMRSPIKKLKIARTKRLSPKANSAISDHIYKVVRSPLKKLKILRSKRLSPKANSTQSDHVYKLKCGDEANVGASPKAFSPQVDLLGRSPLKIIMKEMEGLTFKASSMQVSAVDSFNQEGNEDEAPHSDIVEKSFGTFCDLIDNQGKLLDPKENHDSPSSLTEKNVDSPKISDLPSSFRPNSQETPIWEVELYEHEVDGGILPYKKLEDNKRPQLIRWLQCRGIPSVGNKPELLKLVQACIDEGNSNLLDVKVDNGFPYRMKLQKLYPKQNSAANNIPEKGWGSFVSVGIPKLFNYGHIYSYLVESAPQLPIPEPGPSQEELFDALESEDDDCAADGLMKDPFEDSECPCLFDEKPLRRGMKFLKSGHVHSLSDTLCRNTYHVKASVAPSMPGEDKKTGVSISSISGSVLDGYCSCKASALGRCSHVAALLLYILRHVKLNGYDGMYKVGVWSGKFGNSVR